MSGPQDCGRGVYDANIAAAPSRREGLVAYVLENVRGLRRSEAYEVTFFGDHTDFLECGNLACSALAAYIISLVDKAIDDPSLLEEIRPALDDAFEVIEKLSSSNEDGIIADVTTGAFEDLASCENDNTFSAILNRLGPKSRALYDFWTSRMFPREPFADPGITL